MSFGGGSVYEKWLLGAFCAPGFPRFGENFRYGRYDYRSWADEKVSWELRGEAMRKLLQRAQTGRWHLELPKRAAKTRPFLRAVSQGKDLKRRKEQNELG